ncbi:dihydropteroate synthase [Leptospira ognonensis]|nr:dihydropteroate synthase [Leptospira ognonensis]
MNKKSAFFICLYLPSIGLLEFSAKVKKEGFVSLSLKVDPSFMSECFGILNVTEDSFSDGGAFLNPENAERQAIELLSSGSDWIEISGQSSNVQAQLITEEEEWNRIRSILPFLSKQNIRISLDSFRPAVQKKGLEYGVHCLNDISGFTHPDAKSLLQDELAKRESVFLVVMHSHTQGIAKQNSSLTPANVMDQIRSFFLDRQKEIKSWGVREQRIYLDPGMGFFLSEDPEVSFTVLKNLDKLLCEFPRLMVSVSRKSFLSNALGGIPPLEREFATLAAEIFLLQKKIPWIRTHNVLKVKQAEAILQKLDLLSA